MSFFDIVCCKIEGKDREIWSGFHGLRFSNSGVEFNLLCWKTILLISYNRNCACIGLHLALAAGIILLFVLSA